MKKLFLIVSVLVILSSSCTKDKQEKQQNTGNLSFPKIEKVTYSNELKSGVTMLEFQTIADFESTVNTLENAVLASEEAFKTQWGYLDEAAYNTKIDELAFNRQQPLINFENSQNFTNSLRQAYDILMAEWLNHPVLDMNTYPKKNYPFSLAEMTVLNSQGEVKIGGAILRITAKGFVWITDNDFTKLIKLNIGDSTVLFETNVVFSDMIGDGAKGDCKWWAGDNYPDNYETGKEVIMHLHFHEYPWKGVSEAEIDSYKMNGNGNWKSYAIDLGVYNTSHFYDKECSSFITRLSGWDRKHRSHLQERCSDYGAFPAYRAKNGASVWGSFEYAGHTAEKILSW